MDHDTKVGGILFGAIALWLAVSGFKDIKAGLVKGRGRAIAAMGLSGLATLGMFGALTLTEPAVAPIADSLGPSAAIVAPPTLANVSTAAGANAYRTTRAGSERQAGQTGESAKVCTGRAG